MTRKITHSDLNKILAIVCMLLGLYLLLTPLVGTPFDQSNDFPSGKNIQTISNDSQKLEGQPNYLEFTTGPKIKSEILEGSNISVIDQGGLWRVAKSSNDPTVSNMVIVGHNFDYTNTKPPFRNLSDAKVGDIIRLVWQNKIYKYKVVNTKVHNPNDTFVESPTEKPTLTLYTCYPMFMASQRFVVTAEKI